MIRARAAGLSDRGLRRSQNEDALFLDPQARLFLVSDGMGGQPGGEIASDLVARTVAAAAPGAAAWREPERELVELLARADVVVREQATGPLDGMGATAVVLFLTEASAHIAHAGDSRAYRWRAGSLELLTRDHTPETEYGLPPQGNRRSGMITRVIGGLRPTACENGRTDVRPGDRFLLCSDGLTDMIADAVIASVLAGPGTPAELASALVASANAAGGRDNITVIVIELP